MAFIRSYRVLVYAITFIASVGSLRSEDSASEAYYKDFSRRLSGDEVKQKKALQNIDVIQTNLLHVNRIVYSQDLPTLNRVNEYLQSLNRALIDYQKQAPSENLKHRASRAQERNEKMLKTVGAQIQKSQLKEDKKALAADITIRSKEAPQPAKRTRLSVDTRKGGELLLAHDLNFLSQKKSNESFGSQKIKASTGKNKGTLDSISENLLTDPN